MSNGVAKRFHGVHAKRKRKARALGLMSGANGSRCNTAFGNVHAISRMYRYTSLLHRSMADGGRCQMPDDEMWLEIGLVRT